MFATTFPARLFPLAILLFTTLLTSTLPALATPLPSPPWALAPALAGPGPISLPEDNSFTINPPPPSRPSFNSPTPPNAFSAPSLNTNTDESLAGLTSLLGSSELEPSSPLGSADRLSALSTNPSFLLGRTYVQNAHAEARRVDEALERELVAQELAREADGYAGPAPGITMPSWKRLERFVARMQRANRSAGGDA